MRRAAQLLLGVARPDPGRRAWRGPTETDWQRRRRAAREIVARARENGVSAAVARLLPRLRRP